MIGFLTIDYSVFSRILYKWSHTLCTPFSWSGFFTQHNFDMDPCCVYQIFALSVCFLIEFWQFFICFEYTSFLNMCFVSTVDPWTTWVWTVRVHLYVDIFPHKYISKYYKIPQLVESTDAEHCMWRADYKAIHGFLTAWRVGAPNPCVIQGQLYFLLFCGLSVLWQCHFKS